MAINNEPALVKILRLVKETRGELRYIVFKPQVRVGIHVAEPIRDGKPDDATTP